MSFELISNNTVKLTSKTFLVITTIGIAAFLLKILIIGAIIKTNPDAPYISDSIRYLEPADNLGLTGTLHNDGNGNHLNPLQVAPAYPFFIHAVNTIFGTKISGLLFAQAALATIIIFSTSAIVYLLTRNFTATVLAASLSFLDPLMTYYSGVVLTEVFFTCIYSCIALFGVYLLNNLEHTKYRYTFASLMALSLAVCTLTRPITEYLLYMIGLGMILFCPMLIHKKNKLGITATIVLVAILPTFMATKYWQHRNETLTGVSTLSDNSAEIMLNWKAAGLKAYQKGISRKQAALELNNILTNKPEYSDTLSKEDLLKLKASVGISYIIENKVDYILWSFKDLIKILVGTGNQAQIEWYNLELQENSVVEDYSPGERVSVNYSKRILNLLTYPPWFVGLQFSTLLVLAVVYILIFKLLITLGAWYRYDINKFVSVIFLFGLATYVILLSTGHSSANSRFRVPAMPILISLASLGSFQLSSDKSRKSTQDTENI